MHGSGLTHIVWSLHEQFYITNGFNVLSVDLPGHGNSQGPALNTIERISDWASELLQKLNIKKINFVGHSQGCLVGIDFASRYPNLTEKLILRFRKKLSFVNYQKHQREKSKNLN